MQALSEPRGLGGAGRPQNRETHVQAHRVWAVGALNGRLQLQAAVYLDTDTSGSDLSDHMIKIETRSCDIAIHATASAIPSSLHRKTARPSNHNKPSKSSTAFVPRSLYHATGFVQQCVRVAEPHDSTQSRQSHFVVVVQRSHSSGRRAHLNLNLKPLDSCGRYCICRSGRGGFGAAHPKAVSEPPTCTGSQCRAGFPSPRGSCYKPAKTARSREHDQSCRRVNGQARFCFKVDTPGPHKPASTCYAGIYHYALELDPGICHLLEIQ